MDMEEIDRVCALLAQHGLDEGALANVREALLRLLPREERKRHVWAASKRRYRQRKKMSTVGLDNSANA